MCRFGAATSESVMLTAEVPVHNITAPSMSTYQLAPLSLMCVGLESPVDLGMQAREQQTILGFIFFNACAGL
jgi:hypothetical protein